MSQYTTIGSKYWTKMGNIAILLQILGNLELKADVRLN